MTGPIQCVTLCTVSPNPKNPTVPRITVTIISTSRNSGSYTPWFFFVSLMQIQSLSGPEMTSEMMVRTNGERPVRPVWATVKLYGGSTKMTPLTTEKTTIQLLPYL